MLIAKHMQGRKGMVVAVVIKAMVVVRAIIKHYLIKYFIKEGLR
jgi:hypothetical protein